ncbi:hypothetical protein ACFJI0_21330 [Hydrogenophaga sp. UC242_53]|uniref:hypothetical protein n=1 Tax=Hydrogenophaga sp. UC242_53 TaxID=3350170 RepID=UPI0036D4275A
MSSVPFSPVRRRLLQGSGAIAATRFTGLMGALYASNARAATGKQAVSAVSPYGPVSPVNDMTTGLPLLQLPAGFSYRSHGWTGDAMSDGFPHPGQPRRHGRGDFAPRGSQQRTGAGAQPRNAAWCARRARPSRRPMPTPRPRSTASSPCSTAASRSASARAAS